jgi:hypothetical protein
MFFNNKEKKTKMTSTTSLSTTLTLRKPRLLNKQQIKYKDEQAISKQIQLEYEKEEFIKDVDEYESLGSSLSSIESAQDSFDYVSNLNELIQKSFTHLQNIEFDYNIDDLFNYLRYYLNYSNYAGLTLKSLDAFYKSHSFMQNVNKRFSILMKDKSIGIIPYLPQSITDSVPKLFKLIKSLQCLYRKIQKDILTNVLIKDHIEQDLTSPSSKLTLRLPKKSYQEAFSPELIQERRNFINNSRLNRFHNVIYDLNRKISILLYDDTHSDTNIFSVESKLTSKYEFFRHGEYLVRLIPDILYKIRLILKISQACFEITCRKSQTKSNLQSEDYLKLPSITKKGVRFEANIQTSSNYHIAQKKSNKKKLNKQPKATPIVVKHLL